MDKPEVLYHASQETDIELFEPRNEKPRFVGEEALVFATPYKAVAAMFLASKHPMVVEINRFGDEFALVVNGSYEEFIKKDGGGAIYNFPPNTFTTHPGVGMGETEWVSRVPVKPLSKTIYDSSSQAMVESGVKIYFVDDEKFYKIQQASDHGLEIIKNLATFQGN